MGFFKMQGSVGEGDYLMGQYAFSAPRRVAALRLQAFGGEESPTVLQLELGGELLGPEIPIQPSGNQPVFLNWPAEVNIPAGARMRCKCVRSPGPDGQARRVSVLLS